jgi:putative heme-binding domain-containing protein
LLEQLRRREALLVRLRAAEVFATAEPPVEAFEDFLELAAAEASISPAFIVAAARRSSLSPETTSRLLEYFALNVERGWPVTESELDWVLQGVPEGARAPAAKLSQALRNQEERQQVLLREYEPLLTGGDAARGRALFFDKAQCFTCHTVGNLGQNIGPDLTKLGAIRSGRDILESVVLPSATFAQGYDTYVAETTEDESIAGMLGYETADSIVLRTASGAETPVQRNQLKSLTKSRLSLMPEGLVQGLTREEAADLFAFLQDLK